VISSFLEVICHCHHIIADISFPPLPVELLLNQLHNSLLLGFDACLLLAESIQLGLPVSDFLSEIICVFDPRIGVPIPNVKDRDQYISAQIVECLWIVSDKFS